MTRLEDPREVGLDIARDLKREEAEREDRKDQQAPAPRPLRLADMTLGQIVAHYDEMFTFAAHKAAQAVRAQHVAELERDRWAAKADIADRKVREIAQVRR